MKYRLMLLLLATMMTLPVLCLAEGEGEVTAEVVELTEDVEETEDSAGDESEVTLLEGFDDEDPIPEEVAPIATPAPVVPYKKQLKYESKGDLVKQVQVRLT